MDVEVVASRDAGGENVTTIEAQLPEATRDAAGAPIRTADLADVIGVTGTPRLSDNALWLERVERSFSLPRVKCLGDLRGLYHGERIIVHGSGPSIRDTLPEVIELVAGGAKLMAINAAHDWLLSKGLKPDFGILADPKDYVAGYQTLTPGVKYFTASQCHDDVFARFKGHDEVYVWHAMRGRNQTEMDGFREKIQALVQKYQRNAYCSAEGGPTTGMRGWDIAGMLGASFSHLVGMDSSGAVEGEKVTIHGHAKPHVVEATSRAFYIVDIANGRQIDRSYRSNVAMAHQAMHWGNILRRRLNQMRAGTYPPMEITVHEIGRASCR